MRQFNNTTVAPLNIPTIPPPPLPYIETPWLKSTYTVTFSQLTRAALIIGLSVFLVGSVLLACLVLLLQDLRPYTLPLFALILIASVITAGALTIRWNHELAVRHWRLEDEDRQVRQALSVTSTDPITLPATDRPDSDRLRLAGYNLLALHYVHGLQATRPECERSLHMTQSDWNRLNHLLKLLNIKDERGWNAEVDHAAALLRWTSDVQITQDAAMLRTAPGSWKRIEL